jgi:hypothetical protein
VSGPISDNVGCVGVQKFSSDFKLLDRLPNGFLGGALLYFRAQFSDEFLNVSLAEEVVGAEWGKPGRNAGGGLIASEDELYREGGVLRLRGLGVAAALF